MPMATCNVHVCIFFFFILYFLPNMEHQDPVNLVDISHLKQIKG